MFASKAGALDLWAGAKEHGESRQATRAETLAYRDRNDFAGNLAALALFVPLPQAPAPFPNLESPQKPRHLPRLSPRRSMPSLCQLGRNSSGLESQRRHKNG